MYGAVCNIISYTEYTIAKIFRYCQREQQGEKKTLPFACVSISMVSNPLDDIAYKYLSFAMDGQLVQNQCNLHKHTPSVYIEMKHANFRLITKAKLTVKLA